METSRGPRVRLGPRLTYVYICVPLLVTALQYHMVSVGLGDMSEDLAAPLRWVGWVITGFTVASASVQPIAGKLGDRFGSRTIFAAGLVGFAGASLACAVAPDIYFLILARGVQGFSAGMMMPTSFALVAAAFPERRAQAVGLLSSMVPIGTLVGPNLGGVIVENFGWRATFLVNVPIAVVMAAGAFVLLPAVPGRATAPIDVRGALLLAAVVASFVYGMTELGGDSSRLYVAAVIAVSVGLAVVFGRHERRVAAPIIDLDLLRERAFVVANSLSFLYGAALVGLFGFIPLYVQTRYGMSPTESGLVLTPRAIAMVGVSALVAMMLGRIGYRRPIAFGLVIIGTSSIALSLGLVAPTILGLQFTDFMWITVVTTAVGVAYAFIGPPLNNVGIDLAPDRIASISGLRGTFRSVGGAVGAAFVVLVVSLSPDVPTGLERSFLVFGIVTLSCLVLVRMVPEPRRGRVFAADDQAPSTTSATRRI